MFKFRFYLQATSSLLGCFLWWKPLISPVEHAEKMLGSGGRTPCELRSQNSSFWGSGHPLAIEVHCAAFMNQTLTRYYRHDDPPTLNHKSPTICWWSLVLIYQLAYQWLWTGISHCWLNVAHSKPLQNTLKTVGDCWCFSIVNHHVSSSWHRASSRLHSFQWGDGFEATDRNPPGYPSLPSTVPFGCTSRHGHATDGSARWVAGHHSTPPPREGPRIGRCQPLKKLEMVNDGSPGKCGINHLFKCLWLSQDWMYDILLVQVLVIV